jgi:hypothetical protein
LRIFSSEIKDFAKIRDRNQWSAFAAVGMTRIASPAHPGSRLRRVVQIREKSGLAQKLPDAGGLTADGFAVLPETCSGAYHADRWRDPRDR